MKITRRIVTTAAATAASVALVLGASVATAQATEYVKADSTWGNVVAPIEDAAVASDSTWASETSSDEAVASEGASVSAQDSTW